MSVVDAFCTPAQAMSAPYPFLAAESLAAQSHLTARRWFAQLSALYFSFSFTPWNNQNAWLPNLQVQMRLIPHITPTGGFSHQELFLKCLSTQSIMIVLLQMFRMATDEKNLHQPPNRSWEGSQSSLCT
jgi:hypothetical protein